MCIFARMKVGEAIWQYIVYISTERRLAARTVKIYSENLELFRQYLVEMHVEELDEVGITEVRGWQRLLTERQLKPRSVRYYMSPLFSWFKYLRRQGLVSGNVMQKVVLPRLPKDLPVFFREQEAEHIYTDENLFADTFMGRRDHLLLRLLYETGVRRAEASQLREHWVDTKGLTLRVHGKRDKDRYVPITRELAEEVEAYLEEKHRCGFLNEELFVNSRGGVLSPSSIYNVVHKYMQPLSNAKRVSPHVFRHSFATHMLSSGADISSIKELLGHSDLSTTVVYTHVSREHLKETYKHAHPRASKK